MLQQITDVQSENDLIAEVQQGNRNAFKQLFYQYYNKLIEFCYYRVKNLDASKDLVQEVFMNLWINREQLDPNKSIKAYIYKSLTNRIINLSKHSSSKTIILDESIKKSNFEKNLSLDDRIDMKTAIDTLPEKLKTTFMLSRIEGFKYSEIADICDISTKAVEKRMTKALKILRKIIER